MTLSTASSTIAHAADIKRFERVHAAAMEVVSDLCEIAESLPTYSPVADRLWSVANKIELANLRQTDEGRG